MEILKNEKTKEVKLEKRMSEVQLEDIVMRLPMYDKIEIDLEWGEEREREEYEGVVEYYTETSKDYQALIRMMTGCNDKVHGVCPICKVKTYFNIGETRVFLGDELDWKVISKDIRSYCDEQIDSGRSDAGEN